MAKRFRFRLQPLLDLRKRREAQQQRIVALRLAQLAQLCDRLSQLHHNVTATIASARRDRQVEGLDINTALQEQRWRYHLKRTIARQESAIEQAQSALRDERAELARRATQHKAIERLKERRLAEHNTAVTRSEQAEADEIAARSVAARSPSPRFSWSAQGPGRRSGDQTPTPEFTKTGAD